MQRLIRPLVATFALIAATSLGCCAPSEPSPWVRPRRAEPSASRTAPVPTLDLRVEYAGCATVLLSEHGQLECIYKPGSTLRLWVVHERGQQPSFSMDGDGAWSMGEPYALSEELGQGYRIKLEGKGLQAVSVTLPERPTWRLKLRAWEELSEKERSDLGELGQKFTEVERELTLGNIDVLPSVHDLIRSMLDQRQLHKALQSGLGAAYHLTWTAGRPDLAHELLDDVDSAIHQVVPEFERAYPFGGAAMAIYLGHVLNRRGRLADSARKYREGTRLARRVEDHLLKLDGMSTYALTLADLGYFEAAAYWSAEARDTATEHARPYMLAATLATVAKVSLRLQQAHQVYDDPLPKLDEISRIYADDGPLAGNRVPLDAVFSRAEVWLETGKPERVLERLEEFQDRLTTDEMVKREALWLRALVEAKAEPAEVRRSLDRLRELAQWAVGPEFRWKTKVLEAWVLEALNETDLALKTYQHAEVLLDKLLPLAALGIPGDFSSARHGVGTKRLVELLASQGKIADAICAIRHSRARTSQLALLHRRFRAGANDVLLAPIERYNLARIGYEELLRDSAKLAGPAYERARLLAARRRQELEQQATEILTAKSDYDLSPSCDDLPDRGPGELLLVLYPNGQDLHVYISGDDGVARYPTLKGYFDAEPKGGEWSRDLLLQPLRSHLQEAKKVRVLASGQAKRIAVHAMPWSDGSKSNGPLIQHMPVVYGLDLRAPVKEQQDRHRAFVLADQRADGAQSEALEVASVLGERGWEPVTAVAQHHTPQEIRQQLSNSDLFHYAGHAYFADERGASPALDGKRDDYLRRWPPYSGGAASEPSYIPSGEQGKLTVPDILMMERVPHTVALMGCVTGVDDDRMAYGGFSLATAFLAAGARTVLASTDEINSVQAAALGRRLYAGMEPGLSDDPSRWMTHALTSMSNMEMKHPEITNYRVYVP